MGVSGFHAQFKVVTAMSPLQFQKHIRLQEARRLMIANDLKRRSCNSRLWRVIAEDRCDGERRSTTGRLS